MHHDLDRSRQALPIPGNFGGVAEVIDSAKTAQPKTHVEGAGEKATRKAQATAVAGNTQRADTEPTRCVQDDFADRPTGVVVVMGIQVGRFNSMVTATSDLGFDFRSEERVLLIRQAIFPAQHGITVEIGRADCRTDDTRTSPR